MLLGEWFTGLRGSYFSFSANGEVTAWLLLEKIRFDTPEKMPIPAQSLTISIEGPDTAAACSGPNRSVIAVARIKRGLFA